MIEGNFDITAEKLVYSNDKFAIVKTNDNCYKISKDGKCIKLFKDGCTDYIYIENIYEKKDRKVMPSIFSCAEPCIFFVKNNNIYSIYGSLQTSNLKTLSGRCTNLHDIEFNIYMNSKLVAKKDIIKCKTPNYHCNLINNIAYFSTFDIGYTADIFAFDATSCEIIDYGNSNYINPNLNKCSVMDYLILNSRGREQDKLIKNGKVIAQADNIQLCRRDDYIGFLLTTDNKLKVLRVSNIKTIIKPKIDIEKVKNNINITYKENMFDVYNATITLKDVENSKCITTIEQLYKILQYSLDENERRAEYEISKVLSNKLSFILKIDGMFDREEHKITLEKQTDDMKVIERKVDYLLNKVDYLLSKEQ